MAWETGGREKLVHWGSELKLNMEISLDQPSASAANVGSLLLTLAHGVVSNRIV